MGFPDIEEWLIGNVFDCGIKVNGVSVRPRLGQLLTYRGGTLTKVVFPVPDIPMAIMQQLLLSMLLIL